MYTTADTGAVDFRAGLQLNMLRHTHLEESRWAAAEQTA